MKRAILLAAVLLAAVPGQAGMVPHFLINPTSSSSSGVSVSGTPSSGQLAIWDSASGIAGQSSATVDGSGNATVTSISTGPINLSRRDEALGSTACVNSDATASCTATNNPGRGFTRLTGGAASNLTFAGTVNPIDGKFINWKNDTIQSMTIANESTTEATAADRITTGTGADGIVKPGRIFSLIYDAATSRWVPLGGPPSLFQPRILNAVGISKTNSSTSEQDVNTITFSGSPVPTVGIRYHVVSGGTLTMGTTGHHFQWRTKMGGVTVCDGGSQTVTSTGTINYAVDAWMMLRTNSSTAVASCEGTLNIYDTTKTFYSVNGLTGSSINVTAAYVVKDTITLSDTGGTDTYLENTGFIEQVD